MLEQTLGPEGGKRAPTGEPRKPIGQDEEENLLGAKGEMRRHLSSISNWRGREREIWMDG